MKTILLTLMLASGLAHARTTNGLETALCVTEIANKAERAIDNLPHGVPPGRTVEDPASPEAQMAFSLMVDEGTSIGTALSFYCAHSGDSAMQPLPKNPQDYEPQVLFCWADIANETKLAIDSQKDGIHGKSVMDSSSIQAKRAFNLMSSYTTELGIALQFYCLNK